MAHAPEKVNLDINSITNNATIKLPRRKVRQPVQRQVTPVGWHKLVSSWWGRSMWNCCYQHCLILAAMKTTEKSAPQKKPQHIPTCLPPTHTDVYLQFLGLERGLSKHTHTLYHTHTHKHTNSLKETDDGEVTTAVETSSDNVWSQKDSGDWGWRTVLSRLSILSLISVNKENVLVLGNINLQMGSI